MKLKLLFSVLFILFSVSFAATNYTLTGKILYSNNSNVSGANISIYSQSSNMFGPPTYVLNSSNITNGTGYFTLYYSVPDQNTFSPMRLRITYNNSAGAVTFMGPSLPDLPAQMIGDLFNNSNITIYPASRLFVNASRRWNSTNFTEVQVNFSSMLADSKYGFAMDSAMPQPGGGDSIYNISINLLSNRNYTLTIFKTGNLQQQERGSAPRAVTISDNNLTNNLDGNGTYYVNVNLTDIPVFLSGNLSVNATGMSVGDPINYTDLIFYPYASGKVPIDGVGINPRSWGNRPGGQDFGADLNFTGSAGAYNATMMGSAGGLSYMMVVYGFNGTAPGAAGTRYFGGFQNITLFAGNVSNFNITLYELAGYYVPGAGRGDPNATKYVINLSNNDTNSMGGRSVGSGSLEIIINYTNATGFSQAPFGGPNGQGPVNIDFIGRPNSSGTIAFPIIKNINFKPKIYSQQFSPIKKTLNSSTNGTNFELTGQKMSPPNSSLNNSYSDLKMTFFRSNSSCDVQEPDLRDQSQGGCLLSNFTFGGGGPRGNFNPMKIMMNGEKINLLIEDNNTGIKTIFIGVDLFASGPPTMQLPNGSISNSSSGNTLQKKYRFGSTAPEVFSYAFIAMPYSSSEINDAGDIQVLLTNVYDEDWSSKWSTAQENSTAIPSDFADYNATLFNSTLGGMTCSKTDITSTCFVNTTTKRIWVKLPHFSGSDPQVSGSSTSSSVSTGGSTGSATPPTDITNTLYCPQSNIIVTATSRGNPLSDMTIRLLLTNPYSVEVGSKQTDGNGNATFDLNRSGSYDIDAFKSGYKKPPDLFFDYDAQACLAVGNVSSNITRNITIIVEAIVPTSPKIDTTTNSPPVDKNIVNPTAPSPEEQQKTNALKAISDADSKISEAIQQSKDVTQARQKLSMANDAISSKDYANAINYANQALALAQSAPANTAAPATVPEQSKVESKGSNMLGTVAIGAVIIIILAGLFYFMGRKKK